MSKFDKIKTAILDPKMAFDFILYRTGLRSSVPTAFGGDLWASSYSELLTARNLSLSEQERMLLEHIPEHGVAFDIGAHIGIWTVPMALRRPNANIYAFEGAEATFGQLRDNIERNGLTNARALHCAVSDHEGGVVFESPANASVFGRILAAGNTRGRYNQADKRSVPSTTITAFCAKNKLRYIDFMKVDVEGAELNVLRGALPLLLERKIAAIWMEIDPINQRDFGTSVETLAEFLAQVRYGARRLSTPDVVVNLRAEHENNMLIMPLSQ